MASKCDIRDEHPDLNDQVVESLPGSDQPHAAADGLVLSVDAAETEAVVELDAPGIGHIGGQRRRAPIEAARRVWETGGVDRRRVTACLDQALQLLGAG